MENGKKTFSVIILEQLEKMEVNDTFEKIQFMRKHWGQSDYFVDRSFSVLFTQAKKKLPERKYQTIKGVIHRIE